MGLLTSKVKEEPVSRVNCLNKCHKCGIELDSSKCIEDHETLCSGHEEPNGSPCVAYKKRKGSGTKQVQFLRQFSLWPIEYVVEKHNREEQISSGVRPKVSANISFSSPLGQMLLPVKTEPVNALAEDQDAEHDYSQYSSCRNLRKQINDSSWPVTWKHPNRRKDNWTHVYSYSKRQRRERFLSIITGLSTRSCQQLLKCKEVRVELRKLTAKEIEYYTNPKQKLNKMRVQYSNRIPFQLPSICLPEKTYDLEKTRARKRKFYESVLRNYVEVACDMKKYHAMFPLFSVCSSVDNKEKRSPLKNDKMSTTNGYLQS